MENFTPRAQQVLALARKEAERFNHNFVGTEHVLLGIISLGQGTAVSVLTKMGLDLDTVRLEVEKQIGTGPTQNLQGVVPPYTPRVKKVLSLAGKEAQALNHTYIGTEHILLGLLREGDGVAARVLRNLDVNAEVTRQYVLKELDPNYIGSANQTTPQNLQPQKTLREPVDVAKRYDVYCREGQHEIVYRNAFFKGIRTLFSRGEYDIYYEYIELEQADGQTVCVARWSIVKFCETRETPEGQTRSSAASE